VKTINTAPKCNIIRYSHKPHRTVTTVCPSARTFYHRNWNWGPTLDVSRRRGTKICSVHWFWQYQNLWLYEVWNW